MIQIKPRSVYPHLNTHSDTQPILPLFPSAIITFSLGIYANTFPFSLWPYWLRATRSRWIINFWRGWWVLVGHLVSSFPLTCMTIHLFYALELFLLYNICTISTPHFSCTSWYPTCVISVFSRRNPDHIILFHSYPHRSFLFPSVSPSLYPSKSLPSFLPNFLFSHLSWTNHLHLPTDPLTQQPTNPAHRMHGQSSHASLCQT